MITRDAGKQRLMRFNAPLHRLGKLLSVHLSKELRERYGARSLPVRKGDTVAIVRGDFKGVEGDVIRVDRGRQFVYVQGVTRQSAEGTQVSVPIRPANLVLRKVKTDDKWRQKILDRKAQSGGVEAGQ